jgi:very-short-patch-repair endonuclease
LNSFPNLGKEAANNITVHMIIPQKITEISRELRKNMTEAERILWNELRGKKL